MYRRLFAALASIVFAAQVAAFEIESETDLPVANPTDTLRILSTADTQFFLPAIRSFQTAHPGVAIRYVTASSTEVVRAIEEGASFDLVVSSAMDLQTKLANDGYAAPIDSSATQRVPDWAKWRNSVFAFTQEPATLVLSADAFQGLALPAHRQDLIETLRNNPERFMQRIGTYDIRDSGLGYLFATQDSRTSETFWRLTEVIGALSPRLYCCSSDMIDDVSSGKIAFAYNVLGSYARARSVSDPGLIIIEPSDYTSTMQRSILMLRDADAPDAAVRFVNHLLAETWDSNGIMRDVLTLPAPEGNAANRQPIRLGPGLLVFLDQLKRAQFLESWENAVVQ